MLFQTNVRFLGHIIEKGKIIPINRSIEFANRFPDKIIDKNQLQRFLGSLNYIAPYYENLARDSSILYDRLKKNPKPWNENHTKAVIKIKQKVSNLPCLSIANPNWEKIVETDASDIGYGGILKQISPHNKQEYLVRFHSGKWIESQKNYATIAKEILAILKCVLKFQDDLYNQKFLIKTDCQAAKFMFNKDFKHDVSKQMFARWQSQLAPFDFEISYKKGSDNSLPDFLSREYLDEN
ncbi:putative nucleotidyltransferase, Ribonuclease H [Helianthus anomalus]